SQRKIEEAITPYYTPKEPLSDSKKLLDFIQLTPNIRFLHFKKTFEEDYSLRGEKNDDLVYFGVNLGENFVIKHEVDLKNYHDSRKYTLFVSRNSTTPKMQFRHSIPYEFLTFSISI